MDRHSGSRGFSMVEMMVALVFTMILMAGLGQVFKSSLSASYLMGEKISSLRRNRGSMDLLYDDLNSAGMVLVDVTSPLTALSPSIAITTSALLSFADVPRVPVSTDLPKWSTPKTKQRICRATCLSVFMIAWPAAASFSCPSRW